eukprot:scaffold129727_cov31-Tisochrysis_lutea.AAC.2
MDERWEQICQGLSGPGLSQTDHIAPTESYRPRLALDRAGLLVSSREQRLQQIGWQRRLHKAADRVWDRLAIDSDRVAVALLLYLLIRESGHVWMLEVEATRDGRERRQLAL